MCGIAGCSFSMVAEAPDRHLTQMNEVMRHRGPDDGDYSFDQEMALCHRRLSIIDLSENGRQPMQTADGNLSIVFNGEIYNFLELRKNLETRGVKFRTQTDTEVLLAAYKMDGIDCFQEIRGMYAFGIWDGRKKELLLCRDRIGKKPLYYYFNGKEIAFASEIKSILCLPGIRKEIDPTALADYLKYLYVPHPKSIYKNIYKLEPGHFLMYKNGTIKIEQYWDIDFSGKFTQNEDEIAAELLSLITESTKMRLISDVPLGAFLSGGVDSSGIVALMSKISQKPVQTCTIGFEDENYNEAVYAKNFAADCGAIHHEFYVKDDVAHLLKKLVWHCDEPFADSSMVPTYQVSKVAKKIVTVAVSGDGGDESFAGYEKYRVDQIENRVRTLTPSFLMRFIARVLSKQEQGLGKKALSLSQSSLFSSAEAYYITNSFISDPALEGLLSDKLQQEIRDYNPFEQTNRYYNKVDGLDHLSKILYTDLKSFLPGDILVKVDRMSMANSLEVRSPLLDHKVIEFAAQIPSRLKLKGKEKKFILKKAFSSILSQELMGRKKKGFEVPLDSWLRTELKQMAGEYLLNRSYLNEFFQFSTIKTLWDRHQKKEINVGTNLWSLFMFSLWYEEFMSS